MVIFVVEVVSATVVVVSATLVVLRWTEVDADAGEIRCAELVELARLTRSQIA